MTTQDWAKTTEQAILDAALPLIADLGWNRVAVKRAAAAVGLTPAEAELLLPHGAQDLAALLSRRHDAAMLAALGQIDASSLKVRERISRGVEARIAAALTDEVAVRRLSGFFALPGNIGLGARLNWETADHIWRWAGDTSTDENHYSKRAILSGLLASTLAVRLASGEAAAALHLARGIEAVMAYEKFKARFKGKDWAGKTAEALGKMRYGREAPPVRPV
ncbi:MAG: COQ9 family protein [Caulobacteraceae bacterium]